MSELPESVREQLRKVAALAESGVGGERENAQAMLARLCEKHGVSPEGLLSQERDEVVTLKFSGELEETMLAAVLIWVCQRRDIRYGDVRGGWRVALTKAEAIDAVACWAHYRKLWKEEVAAFASAFRIRHNLFGPPEDAAERKPLSPEGRAQIERLLALARGMRGDTWRRPAAMLEGGGR